MSWLRFIGPDVEKLKQADVDEDTTRLILHFDDYDFDEDSIVHAVIDLFQRASQKGCMFRVLLIDCCTGRIDEVLNAASSMDMFDEISISCDDPPDLSHRAFWSISEAMKFNTRLAKLNLSDMEMTRQQAAALGAGLVTFNSQNHFKELRMGPDVRFFDGAITELASGLKQNSSLCILTVHECHLRDSELAELIGAVESHPSLKELSLWFNYGHKHALVALGKVLASRSCRLEELNFSGQGAVLNHRDGLTGHLGILAQGLQGNESLTHLDLSSNGLLDNDMDHLGKILATCKLEHLKLNGNSITHSGFVSLTQNIPKSLKSFDFSRNDFNKEEAACHILTLFEEHQQLWEDRFNWKQSMSPERHKIQHFKDMNRCGRILLASEGTIPLSVWPIVLARANTLLSNSKERATNAIFHLLQGHPALMDRD